MKRMMCVLAGVAVAACSAFAEPTVTSWFSTGIKDYTTWSAVAESQGAWVNTDAGEISGSAGARYISFDADADAPLKFAVNSGLEKTVGSDTASLIVKSTISFTPFAIDSLDDVEVPENAKGGVIAVKVSDSVTNYYVLAKDPTADPIANKWTATSIVAPGGQTEVTITIAKGEASGVEKITYAFGSTTTETYDIVMSGSVSSANYTGCGEVAALSADQIPAAFDLQFASKPAGVDSVSITVDDEPVTPVEGKYRIANGKTAVMTFTPTEGYMLKTATASVTPTANVTYTADDFPVHADEIVAKIGSEPYASFGEALAAAASGNTITLYRNVVLSDALTFDKGGSTTLTVDLDGHSFTTTVTTVSSGAVKLVNGSGTPGTEKQGGFSPSGVTTVAGGATLDLSDLPFGVVYGGVEGSGSLTIADGGTAIFYEWGAPAEAYDSANWMFGNYPAFFTGSTIPVGGIVKIGSKTWTGAANRFVIAGEAATAVVTGNHNIGGDYSAFDFLESFASLADAVAAVKSGATVTLTKDGSLASTSKAMTVCLGGHDLTISGSELSYDLTVTGDSGRLIRTGAIAVNAKLDLSSLAYDQIKDNTGSFAIGKDGEVRLPVSNSTRELIATGMFAGSVSNAIVRTKADYAQHDGNAWLVDGSHPSQWAGTGTAGDPYKIATKADLLLLKTYSRLATPRFQDEGLYFEQTADISLDGETWNGIGADAIRSKYVGGSSGASAALYFKGQYNGNGKKITNVKFAQKNYQGFFNGLYLATVRNLEIDVVDFDPYEYVADETEYGAGILASVVAVSTVTNVTIGGTLGNASHNCAGFAIKAYDSAFIDCVNNASITSKLKRVSGFVGFESSMGGTGSLTFTRCVNNGNLRVGYTGSDDYGCGGFIAGLNAENVVFTDCVNNGKVETDDPDNRRAGAFIGIIHSSRTKTVVATGCSSRDASLKSIGMHDVNVKNPTTRITVDGLYFATVSGDVATFATASEIAKNGTEYTVMASNEVAFVLAAADQKLKLNTSVAEYAGEVTVSISGYKTAPKATVVGSVTTYEPEAEPTGSVFTLTANGISGTPQYRIGEGSPVDFVVAGAENTWNTAELTEGTVFTVIYTASYAVPSEVWSNTNNVTGIAPTFTMGAAAASAQLDVTDAGELPDTPAGDTAASEAIERAAKKGGLTSEQAADVKAKVSGFGVPAAKWISASKGAITYAGIAAAKTNDVAISCLMGAGEIVTDAKVTLSEMKADSSSANTFDIKVKLTSGDSETAIAYAKDQVEALFQATYSLDPATANWSAGNVEATAEETSSGNEVKFSVAPKDSSKSAAFIRLNIK